MADSTADAAAKKPTLSSRLLQMKFMQRGKEKIVLKDAIAEQVKVEDDSRWVAEPQAGCVVLTEGDPPPGAHFGHMSFSSFNSELQKLQEEHDIMLKAAKKAASLGSEGRIIPDTEMAEELTNLRDSEATIGQPEQPLNGRKGRVSEGRRVTSMREGHRKSHKAGRDNGGKSGHKRKRRPSAQ